MAFKFYLSDLYTRTEILEPEGWGDVKNIIERDFKSHGMFSNYTDGTLKLGFCCDAVDLLETEYLAEGVDGYLVFSVEEAEETSTTYTEIFSAEVDFATRNYNEDIWEAEVNNSNTFLKVKNRAGKKISLNFQQTLEGSNRDRVNYNDLIYSLAKKDNAKFIGTNSGETLDSVQSDAATTNTYLVGACGFLSITDDEIKKSSKVESFLDTSDTGESRDVDRTPILVMEREGDLFIEYDFDIDIDFTPDQYSGSMTFEAQLVLRFDKIALANVNANPLYVLSLDNDTLITSSAYGGTITLAATSSRMARVQAGTKVSIDLILKMQTTGTAQFSAVLDITTYDVTITDKIAQLPTNARYIPLYDAINKHLDFITNDSNFLYSELLGDQLRGYSLDGCLSDLHIINGYNVRRITSDSKYPALSLKDYVDNLRVLGAIGYGIEEINAPTQVGYFDVFYSEIIGDLAFFYVNDNLTYDFTVGDSVGLYNSDTLFGVYPIEILSYNAGLDRTSFYINISANYMYYDAFAAPSNPPENTWFYDVLLTNNSITAEKEVFRIEEWRHFYGTNELLDLGTVEEYREEPFNEALYNSATIGFSKYANDEERPSTFDEFETESEWALPTVKAENNLDLISKWIGSTFLFGESRDRLFINKPTTSHRNDKDIFFTSITDMETTAIVDFDSAAKQMTIPSKVYENYIANSVYFDVSGATDGGNNGSYVIDSTVRVLHDIENDEYIISLAGTRPTATRAADNVTITMDFLNETYKKLEASENMIQTSGLTMPYYMLNQRHTIKRILFRWGSYIKSSIAYYIQTASKIIRNLYYDVNGDFNTEIDTYDLDADCVNVQGLVQENANVDTSVLDQVKFVPNKIYATRKICDSDYTSIQDAHKGKGSTPYGYFNVKTPRGETKQGWLLNMRRSPVDRIAEFELLERYNPPMVFDGTKYGQVSNVAALQVSNFRLEMEVKLYDLPTFPNRYAFADCLSGVASGWQLVLTAGSMGTALADGAANNYGAGSNEIRGNNTYSIFFEKIGLDYTAGFDNVTIRDGTLSSPMVVPTLDFYFGALFGGTSKLIADVTRIKFNSLDGSGNTVAKLLLFDGANDNGVRVLNTAEDAPDNTNMIWK